MSRRQLEQELAALSQRVHALGWVANHDGNITVRLGDGRYLATPTSVSKGAITAEGLIVVDGEGKLVSGKGKPFTEVALHLAVYRARPDVRAVLHAHPPTATGFSVAGIEVKSTLLAEPIVSLGATIPLVPYARPRAPEWLTNLVPFLEDADVLLLENHGVMSYGPDLETAYLRMELVEHLAKIQLVATQVGLARSIPAGDQAMLLESRTAAGLGKAARNKHSAVTAAVNGATTQPKPIPNALPTPAADPLLRAIVAEELGHLLRK